jgi:hypothetical protein
MKDNEKVLKARELCSKVRDLVATYDLPFFFVTDGASITSNNGCDAVRNARKQHEKWELDHGHDPKHDWSNE